ELARLVDDAHAAASQLPQDLVTRHPRPRFPVLGSEQRPNLRLVLRKAAKVFMERTSIPGPVAPLGFDEFPHHLGVAEFRVATEVVFDVRTAGTPLPSWLCGERRHPRPLAA